MTSKRSHAEGSITSAARVLVELAQLGYVDASLVAAQLNDVTGRLRQMLQDNEHRASRVDDLFEERRRIARDHDAEMVDARLGTHSNREAMGRRKAWRLSPILTR